MYVGMMKGKIDEYIKVCGLGELKQDEKFEIFVASMLLKGYGVDSFRIKRGIVDGGRDEGIDSIFISLNGEIIDDIDTIEERIHADTKIKFIFIQSKTSPKFEEDAVNRLNIGLQLVFSDSVLKNEKLQKRAELIRSTWKKWFKLSRREEIEVDIYYTTLSANNDEVLKNDNFSERVSKINDLFESIDIKCRELQYLGCRELDKLYRKLSNYSKELNIVDSFKCGTKVDPVSEHGFLCLVKGNDYFDFITDENDIIEDSIFEENIRDFQGIDNEVNNSIKTTVLEKKHRNFWCYNNGITIIAEAGARTTNSINITNYQIINGCQTSYSIAEALTAMSPEERSKRDFELVIKVIIIDPSKEDEIINIIERTNSQTKIENYAFESYRNVHKKIEDFFKNQLETPYYYERRIGYYKRRNFNSDRIITPKALLQEMYAILYKSPSIARNSISVIFDSYKAEIFSDEVNLQHYFISHEVVNIVRKHISSYDKGLDKVEMFILNNMSLHIARCVFSFIVGKEIKSSKHLKDKELSKLYGKDVYQIILKKQFDINDCFDKSIKILHTALDLIKAKFKEKDFNSIIKKSELDETITMLLARYFTSGNFDELEKILETENERERNVQNLDRLTRCLEDSKRKFRKISSDGDQRYNFYDRIMDVINLLDYYYRLNDLDTLKTRLKQIANSQDSDPNTYQNRIKYAKEFMDLIEDIDKKMMDYKSK